MSLLIQKPIRLLNRYGKGTHWKSLPPLHRWDPAYNVVEMETVLENPLSQEPALHTDENNPSREGTVEAVQTPRHSTTLVERPTAVATNHLREASRPTRLAPLQAVAPLPAGSSLLVALVVL